MDDKKLDIVDKVYLIGQIEKLINDLKNKKGGYSTIDKIDIQVTIWEKLLWHLEEFYNITDKKHQFVFNVDSMSEVSDGNHTFEELYWHRMVLFSVICNNNKDKAWKSWKHHDDTMYDDYFIVGIDTPKGQFTYHYHKDWWYHFDVTEFDKAPEWDGHTANDVVRLMSLNEQPEEITEKKDE